MACYNKNDGVKRVLSNIKIELEANRSFLKDVVLCRLSENDIVFAHRDIVDVMADMSNIEKRIQNILDVL